MPWGTPVVVSIPPNLINIDRLGDKEIAGFFVGAYSMLSDAIRIACEVFVPLSPSEHNVGWFNWF